MLFGFIIWRRTPFLFLFRDIMSHINMDQKLSSPGRTPGSTAPSATWKGRLPKMLMASAWPGSFLLPRLLDSCSGPLPEADALPKARAQEARSHMGHGWSVWNQGGGWRLLPQTRGRRRDWRLKNSAYHVSTPDRVNIRPAGSASPFRSFGGGGRLFQLRRRPPRHETRPELNRPGRSGSAAPRSAAAADISSTPTERSL